jgi:hypothetical protein
MIIDHAIAKGIQPLVWRYSSAYFNPEKRKTRFRPLAEMGVKGVKIDFLANYSGCSLFWVARG